MVWYSVRKKNDSKNDEKNNILWIVYSFICRYRHKTCAFYFLLKQSNTS